MHVLLNLQEPYGSFQQYPVHIVYQSSSEYSPWATSKNKGYLSLGDTDSLGQWKAAFERLETNKSQYELLKRNLSNIGDMSRDSLNL